MLITTITKSQPQIVYIGDNITVYIWWEGSHMKVGVEAPEEFKISRERWEKK